MTIGVKFCGGCNPMYDRGNLFEKTKEAYPDHTFEMADDTKKYEKLLVLHILSTISTPSIVDFGAGQTVYEDPQMLRSIQEAFNDKNFIFLVLPYEDKEKSKKLLQKRQLKQ